MPDYSKTRIQFRRGTAAQFSSANPVLASGEPAFAVDTNTLKIGDGTTAYSSLSAITGGGGGSEVNDLSSVVTWANVPDANITESSVVQHSGALRLTESQIVDLQSYLTAETNDLTSAVTWTNVPDANITESSVVQHSGALRLTESQIVDLQPYLTSESNDLTASVTWANVPDTNITESSVVQHSGAIRITESQITDLQSYLTAVSDDTAPSLGGELNLNNNDMVIDCKNSTGSQILAGTPVYVSGYYSANGKSLIAPARSDDSTKMPAIGLLNSTIDDGNEGTVGVMGVVSQINTNSFEVGETLYVGPTGGLTNVKPSGDSELIQNLGRVLRKDASQGKMILLGAGRSNDVPNVADFNALTVDNAPVVISDTTGITNASGISNIVYMTQAAYTALGSYDANTLYYIV